MDKLSSLSTATTMEIINELRWWLEDNVNMQTDPPYVHDYEDGTILTQEQCEITLSKLLSGGPTDEANAITCLAKELVDAPIPDTPEERRRERRQIDAALLQLTIRQTKLQPPP